MLTKLSTFCRFVPRVNNSRLGHGVPAHWKPLRQVCEETKSHMNCMPVPAGSWQEAYNAKQAKRNMLLLASIASLGLTFSALWAAGCLYLHDAPPAYLRKK